MAPRPSLARLFESIPDLETREQAPLAGCTRFSIGGPARIMVDAPTTNSLAAAWAILDENRMDRTVIGGGSNLLVSDAGFPGAVVRFTGGAIEIDGPRIHAEAGVELQALVDASIAHGLGGLETMTRIPGWVGGAVYGNPGAYGHSIHERIESIRFFDGRQMREIGNGACEFHYRESIFKRRKDWIITGATLRLDPADPAELARTAEEIRKIRDAKYPPTMRCAGSIFKNLFFDELPEQVRHALPASVVREGKVPSAYFLEQAGAKGMSAGPVRVADYHANLIYNSDGGTAAQVRSLIEALKRRVERQFGITLEEEVQYVG